MARPVRIHVPGALYLVHLKATPEQPFFLDEGERSLFWDSLGIALQPTSISLYAFALLESSVFLLLRAGDERLSGFVHRTHAGYLNKLRAHTSRPLPRLRDRHREILVQDALFKPILRRVHLAPVTGDPWAEKSQARKFGEIATNRWTSLAIFSGKIEAPEWLQVQEVLNLFPGETRSERTEELYSYVVEGIPELADQDLLNRVVAMSLLGDSGFVAHYHQMARGRHRMPVQRSQAQPHELDNLFKQIVKKVAAAYEVSPATLLRARSRHPGRRLVVALAMKHALGDGGVKSLGERLKVSGSAVSHMHRAALQELEKGGALREAMQHIEQELFQD